MKCNFEITAVEARVVSLFTAQLWVLACTKRHTCTYLCVWAVTMSLCVSACFPALCIITIRWLSSNFHFLFLLQATVLSTCSRANVFYQSYSAFVQRQLTTVAKLLPSVTSFKQSFFYCALQIDLVWCHILLCNDENRFIPSYLVTVKLHGDML